MRYVLFISLFFIVYTYVGYPLLLMMAVSCCGTKKIRRADWEPPVSILISAYNEEEHISEKIENCLGFDYPPEKLEILIGSDGSTDRTARIAEKYQGRGVRVIAYPERRGKAAVLNRLAETASGKILIFADARQMIGSDAVKNLVRNFADPYIGCVSGELVLRDGNESPIGRGMSLYWKYEKWVRKMESRLGSTPGATGALYAVRKSLFTGIPPYILLDDVYVPMKVIGQGFRSVVEPAAKAFDIISADAKTEFRRKVRTLAGNWQLNSMISEFPGAVRRAGFQYLSHKFLRIVLLFFLVSLFVSSALLVNYPGYAPWFYCQVIFYGTSLMGFIYSEKFRKGNVPYFFCVLNITAVVGCIEYFSGRQSATWEK